jgi:hypothetical protein
VGKALKQAGFRTSDGKPSQKAFRRRLVAQRWAAGGEYYLWAWDAEKTLRVIADE